MVCQQHAAPAAIRRSCAGGTLLVKRAPIRSEFVTARNWGPFYKKSSSCARPANGCRSCVLLAYHVAPSIPSARFSTTHTSRLGVSYGNAIIPPLEKSSSRVLPSTFQRRRHACTKPHRCWGKMTRRFSSALYLWRNHRHEVVLHFESENADHRLINTCLGESPILERLLQRGKIARHFPDAGSSNDHVVASFDREHCRLCEAPLLVDALHEERIRHYHSLIAHFLPH